MNLFSSPREASHAEAGRQYSWAVPAISVLLATVLFVGSAIYFAYTRLESNVQSQDIQVYLDREPEKQLDPYKPGDDINFLILGSDVRERDGAGQAGEVVGMRSDTTMLAHISADRSRVEIVSIPRDTLVDIPSCRLPDGTWTAPKTSAIFNSAFSIGGQTDDVGAAAACTIRTVEGMSGLFIDGFVVVDFASFQHFVDALGGVEMCFEEDLTDSAAGLDVSAGCQVLDGEQALAFARARKAIGDGSDIGRMQRQQDLVLAIAEDALSRNILTDLPSLYRLVDAVSQSIVTDAQLGSLDTLASLANSIRGVSTEDIFLMTMPWDPAGARVLPAAVSEILWEALRDDIALETIFDDNGELRPTDAPTETSTETPAAPVDQTQEAE